jgi:Family of unknown function (DUF6519)
MKVQISRQSHRPTFNYSGLYQVQGGMVTDADLGELSEIAKERLTLLGDISTKNGVPGIGGCISIAKNLPVLQAGFVVGDGVCGELQVINGKNSDTREVYQNQSEFSQPAGLPAEGAVLLYADIWDRVITRLEDPLLTDFGLHGAETSVRTRTVTQIKYAKPEDLEAILKAEGAYPEIGTGTIRATLGAVADTTNGCDPCAEEIDADARLGNTLFRVEVVGVEGEANAPTRIHLAWSMENAAEQILIGDRANGFADKNNTVFELFSKATEQNRGLSPWGQNLERGSFVDKSGLMAADTNLWHYVRRWDGHNIFPGDVAHIATDQIAVEIVFKNKAVLVGDYWLVELREFASATQRVRVVSETPLGIRHHYVPLFVYDCKSNVAEALKDEDRRRLSFPPLSDIPATHVSAELECASGLYGTAKNVQEALEAICGIKARHVGFENKDPDFYGSADTVQEAFEELAKRDFSLENTYRHLFDWGVVCGLKLSVLSGEIIVSPGTFLDRKGKLVTLKAPLKVKLENEGLRKAFDSPQVKLTREVCVSVEKADGGDIVMHFTSQADAVKPADPTYNEAYKACTTKPIWTSTFYDQFASSVVGKNVMVATVLKDATAGSFTLDVDERKEATALIKNLVGNHKTNATASQHADLEAALQLVETKYATIAGSSLAVAAGEKAKEQLQVFDKFVIPFKEFCQCDVLFMECPPAVNAVSGLVPVGCLEFKSLDFAAEPKACMACCRRQALTPRSMRYYFDSVNQFVREAAHACCNPGKDQKPDIDIPKADIGNWYPKTPLGPIKWDTFPQIKDLLPNIAEGILKGNGVDIVDVIDMGQADALEKIIKAKGDFNPIESLQIGEAINPGDTVAMLVKDNKAVGYAVLERGHGKLLFDTAKASIKLPPAKTEAPAIDLELLKDITTKLEAMKVERGAMLGDFEKLAQGRDAMLMDVEKLRKETTELDSIRGKMNDAIANARKELANIEASQKKVIDVAFSSMPAMTVIGDAALSATLAGAGLKTVDDITRVDNARLANVLKNNPQGMTPEKLKSLANEYVKGRQ